MDPPLGDPVTAFEVYDMISSHNDLSIDPSLQPGTSADSARPTIPYQIYMVESSPNSTEYTSSSSGGPPASTSPGFPEVSADEVNDFFNNNNGLGLFTTSENELKENQMREDFNQTMANKFCPVEEDVLTIQPGCIYPTPPQYSEVSPTTDTYTPGCYLYSSNSTNNYSPSTTASPGRHRIKRPRPSSPLDEYPMQPILPPQTPHNLGTSSSIGGVDLRLSPQFMRYEKVPWTMLYDDRQQPMREMTLFIHADRGLVYKDKQEAYVNYRKTHLQLTVNIDCEPGILPKYVLNHQLIPIKDFQIQLYGVRSHNRMSTVPMKQSDKDRKMYPPVFENFEINEPSITRVLRRFHFSASTLHNDQKDGRPNPKQEYFDLVVKLVAFGMDGNEYLIQSHIAHKIISRAGNPRIFGDEDERTIKEEIDDEEEFQSECWTCGANTVSTTRQVVIGGNDPYKNAALTVRGDVIVGSIKYFCDERCKNIYAEKVDSDLKAAYEQLKKLKIFEYSYKEDFARSHGLSPRLRDGFIAQQVREIIPEAVVEMGDFLSVDQAEIFIKSVSALKHLSTIAEEMQGNLEETMKQVAYILETVNRKRMASMGSGLNGSRRNSTSTIMSDRKNYSKRTTQSQSIPDILCGNRFSQCTIISVVVMLVFVMAACLVSMTVLYFVDLTSRYTNNPVPTVFTHKTHEPPAPMSIPMETLANLQHDVSQLAPKCKGKSCMEYCCDKETIGNASAHMLRENVIVPWRDDDVSHYNFGPLNSDVSIFIPELNVTLDRSFCVSHSCDRFKKEYTLFIPLSPTFPKTSLSLFFRVSAGKVIDFCGGVPGFHQIKCKELSGKERHVKVRQLDDTTFELPVGAHLQSGFKFHVGYSSESCVPIKLEERSELATLRTTEEYNFIFYRKCST